MTARKRFKQRVRARAAKTGESYSVARRHLDHRSGQEPRVPEHTTVTNTLHGFVVNLPATWREVPPEALATPWQVAAFEDDRGNSGSGAVVLVTPSQGQNATAIAAVTRAAYEANGMSPVDGPQAFAGGHGYRLEARQRTADGEVTLVDHVVVSADRAYRFILTTNDIDRDREALIEIAKSFNIIEATAPLPDVGQRPALTDRARKAIALARAAAVEPDGSAPTTAHLLYGLVAEGDGMAAVVLRESCVDEDAIKSALASGRRGDAATNTSEENELRQLLIETAPSIARDLGHYYIGTEHLLLAVLASDNRASSVARELGIDFAAVRSRIAEFLTESLSRQATGATTS